MTMPHVGLGWSASSDSQLTSFQILPGFMQLSNPFPELLD